MYVQCVCTYCCWHKSNTSCLPSLAAEPSAAVVAVVAAAAVVAFITRFTAARQHVKTKRDPRRSIAASCASGPERGRPLPGALKNTQAGIDLTRLSGMTCKTQRAGSSAFQMSTSRRRRRRRRRPRHGVPRRRRSLPHQSHTGGFSRAITRINCPQKTQPPSGGGNNKLMAPTLLRPIREGIERLEITIHKPCTRTEAAGAAAQ